MKFIKDTLLTFSTTIITVILGVITSIILARTIGPNNLGVYSLIILTITLLSNFGNLGIAISNTYYGVKKNYKWEELAANSFICSFMLGVILIASFLIFYHFNSSFLKNVDPILVLIALITTPFTIMISYFQYILLGQNRIREFNATSIIQSVLYIPLILFILFFHGSLLEIIFSWTISWIISSIIPVILVYKSNPFKLHFDLNIFKKTTLFGLKSYLGSLIQFFNYRIDMFLIIVLLSNYAYVGYYSISIGLAESLWYLPSAVGTLVLARTPGLTDENKNKSTPIICRNTFFITVILAIILFLIGKFLIFVLYGSNYLPAVEPFWVLLPGVMALSICKILGNEITGRGKPMISTYAAIISLFTNIPLNLILIPKMGIVGSALSSSISYTLMTVILLVIFLKISKNSISDTLIIKKEDIQIYKEFFYKMLNR